jgi:hypothetical protein
MEKNLLLSLTAILMISIASCKKESTPPVTTPPTTTPPVVKTDSLKLGLLAYFPLDNSGADSSGMGHDTYSYYSIVSTTNRFGKANSAFYFDGVDSYMVIKDKSDLRLSNTDFTINIWINVEAYSASYGSVILCKRGPGSSSGWNYNVTGYLDQANGIPLGVNSFQVFGGLDPLAVGTKPLGNNQWHMVTTIYNLQKQEISCYIDGVLDNVMGNVPSPSSTANTDLYVGADSQSSAYYLKGKLDDVRIYDRALPVSQIKKLFALTN